jgi:hypothetical protein
MGGAEPHPKMKHRAEVLGTLMDLISCTNRMRNVELVLAAKARIYS